jgi:two-component system, sensor histidine kinase and response regulator
MNKDTQTTILLVDDMETNIDVLFNALSDDYQLAVALDGDTALQYARANLPDLILLDIMMPEMDGFEVCKRLKENKATAAIPVIFLTAIHEVENKAQGLKLGAVDYVTKPFEVLEVKARVRNHLKLKYAMETMEKEIKERKEAEQSLRESEKKLQEANQAKDKFFSIISHDLRNPLSALISYSSMTLDYYDDLSREKVLNYVTKIKNASGSINKLLDNLLQWSRLQMNRMEFRPARYGLFHIIQENIYLLGPSADRKGISIELSVAKDVRIWADVEMVSTIIRNLVSNAIKFSESGGVIKIASETDGLYEKIVVSDNGTGIRAEDKAKLFCIDVQHTLKGTADEKGTGLGLILCREFVEKNKGRIWVESEYGQGSEFIFILPKEDDRP